MSYDMAPGLIVGEPVAPPGFRSELPDAVVKSAARTIQILEYFDHVRRDVCISEIAQALHYPPSSTSALLRSMVAMGYLQHNRIARTYRMTRRTSLLGTWVDASLVRQGAIVNLAHRLANLTGETVTLGRMNDNRVQVIYVADPPEGKAAVCVGCQHGMAQSAAGLALLSMLEDHQVRRILTRLNAERAEGEEAITLPKAIDDIAKGRRDGVFVAGGSVPGHAALAMQVRHESAGDMLVLAVEGPSARILEHQGTIAKMIKTGLIDLAG